MSEEPLKNSKTQLALAVARGVSVNTWARANGVARRTAFRWARDLRVRKVVESVRRRTLDEAIGRMTKHTTSAADLIVAIAKEAESDSVRLRAVRAIFSDVMAVSKYSGWEARLNVLEEKLEKGKGTASSTAWSRAPNYGQITSPPAVRPVPPVATRIG